VAKIKYPISPYRCAVKTLKYIKVIYKKDRVEYNLMLIKVNKAYAYYPNLIWPKILNIFS
jgi:hypothetical protein